MPGILSKHHQHTLEDAVLSPQLGRRIFCEGCRMLCSGSIYVCRPCNFVLHRSCATAPGKIEHPCHKGHILAFLREPQYDDGRFSCDACGEEGRGFSFHCTACSYDLHIPCAYYPTQVKHGIHEHPLRLLYANPYSHNSFHCNICGRSGVPSLWLYHCAICNFAAHLQCANSPSPPSNFNVVTNSPSRQQHPTPAISYANAGQVRPSNQMQQTISNEAIQALLQQLISMNSQGGGGNQQNPLAAFGAGNSSPLAAMFKQVINGGSGNGPMGSLIQQLVTGGGGGGLGLMGPLMQQFLGGGDGGLGLGLLGGFLGGGGFYC